MPKLRLLPVLLIVPISACLRMGATGDFDDLVVQQGHSLQVRQVLASPVQNFAVYRGDDLVKVWDLATRMLLRTLAMSNLDAMALSPNAPKLAVVPRLELNGPPAVEIWDLERGLPQRSLSSTNFYLEQSIPLEHVEALAISPDGRLCAVAIEPEPTLSNAKHSLILFFCETGESIGKVEVESTQVLRGIESLAFPRDNKTVYMVADDS